MSYIRGKEKHLHLFRAATLISEHYLARDTGWGCMAKVSVGTRQAFTQAQWCQDLENSEGSTAEAGTEGPFSARELGKSCAEEKVMRVLRYGPKASKSLCAYVQQLPSKPKLNGSLMMLC